MLQIRHAELMAEVGAALHAVSAGPGEVFDIEADHCLVEDLRLDGKQILRVFELLEEALSVSLLPSVALDFVIAGPSVGRLVRELARIQQEGKRHAA